MMTMRRTLTTALVAIAVAAGSVVPLATGAEAGSRKGHRYYSGDADFHGYRAHRHRHRHSYDYDGYRHRSYGYYGGYGDGHHYRKKRRNDVGKAIAIGAGLIMLGIIANEAGRRHRY